MNEEVYLKIISGQRDDWLAILFRFGLDIAAIIYSAIIRLRNCLYSNRLLRSAKVEKPVISIGNLTAGGTGKTPLVIWLYNFLQQKEFNCAILTRGYKTADSTNTDEPALLQNSCPHAKVIINPDRAKSANMAINNFGADVLVMDDGFQHRRLARDLDIITIDATNPFGYGKILPAGLLREPIESLKRAHAAVLTRCNQIPPDHLAKIEQKIKSINPVTTLARSVHQPVCAKSASNKPMSIDELRTKKIYAFCGIGNPQAFFNTLKETGLNITGSKIFNDHHRYTADDLTQISRHAEKANANLAITTEKDWTKITHLNHAAQGINFAYLQIELRFLAGQEQLKQLIEKTLAVKIQAK